MNQGEIVPLDALAEWVHDGVKQGIIVKQIDELDRQLRQMRAPEPLVALDMEISSRWLRGEFGAPSRGPRFPPR